MFVFVGQESFKVRDFIARWRNSFVGNRNLHSFILIRGKVGRCHYMCYRLFMLGPRVQELFDGASVLVIMREMRAMKEKRALIFEDLRHFVQVLLCLFLYQVLLLLLFSYLFTLARRAPRGTSRTRTFFRCDQRSATTDHAKSQHDDGHKKARLTDTLLH
jgi:hypothetical protein